MINILKFDFVNNVLKKPLILVYMFVYPIVIFLILSSITSSIFTGGVSSREYYGITSMIFIQLSMGTMISNMLLEDSVKLSNMRLGYILVKPYYIILSKVIVLTIWNIVSIIFYLFVCNLFFNVNFGKMAIFIGMIYLACGLLSISLGLLLCHIFKDESLTNNLFGAVQTVICIVGGVFFQPWLLGKNMVFLSKFSFAKWVIQAVSKAIYQYRITEILCLSAALFLVAVIIITVVNKLFKLESYLK